MQIAELRPWIETQQVDFLQALKGLVEINTFTSNTRGVDLGMDALAQLAEAMGMQVESIRARHRLIKNRQPKTGKRILLVSHMDTVHPPDGDFQQFSPQADDYISGPGIGDMKGGLLMGLWSMMALQQLAPSADVQLIVSADEEHGSPSLQDWYLSEEHGADYAIGLEPGFPQGALHPEVAMGFVTQRKGCGRVSFAVQGRASHAGGAWQDGLNAIEGMAQRILKIQALADPEGRGVTTNVGLVAGGTAANTIAERCTAVVDFRYWKQADGRALLEEIRQIAETPAVYNRYHDLWDEGADFSLDVFMPAMEHSPASDPLIQIVEAEAARLGQNYVAIARGGGSDANYLSGAGVPAICGMGAPAEGIHTTQERILAPMLFDRLEVLIASLYRAATTL